MVYFFYSSATLALYAQMKSLLLSKFRLFYKYFITSLSMSLTTCVARRPVPKARLAPY